MFSCFDQVLALTSMRVIFSQLFAIIIACVKERKKVVRRPF